MFDPRRTIRRSTHLLPLAVLAACATTSGPGSGLARVEELTQRIELASSAMEACKQRVEGAVTAFQELIGGAVSATSYGKLQQAIADSETQSTVLADRLDAAKAAAEPVFAQWAKDLEAMSNAELRQRGQLRLDEARARHQTLLESVGPVQTAHQKLNRDLRDYTLFLNHDLNRDAVAALGNDVAALKRQATELCSGLDACRTAAQRYVAAATPSGHAAAPSR